MANNSAPSNANQIQHVFRIEEEGQLHHHRDHHRYS